MVAEKEEEEEEKEIEDVVVVVLLMILSRFRYVLLFLVKFTDEKELDTDRPTYRRTDGQTLL